MEEEKEKIVWENTAVVLRDDSSVLDECNNFGSEGWQPWHKEKNEAGDQVIFFKRCLTKKD